MATGLFACFRSLRAIQASEAVVGLLPGAQGLSALDACLVSGYLPRVGARRPAPRLCLSSRCGFPVSGLLLCFVLFLDVGVAS